MTKWVDHSSANGCPQTPGVLARRSCAPPRRNHGLLATVDVRETSDSGAQAKLARSPRQEGHIRRLLERAEARRKTAFVAKPGTRGSARMHWRTLRRTTRSTYASPPSTRVWLSLARGRSPCTPSAKRDTLGRLLRSFSEKHATCGRALRPLSAKQATCGSSLHTASAKGAPCDRSFCSLSAKHATCGRALRTPSAERATFGRSFRLPSAQRATLGRSRRSPSAIRGARGRSGHAPPAKRAFAASDRRRSVPAPAPRGRSHGQSSANRGVAWPNFYCTATERRIRGRSCGTIGSSRARLDVRRGRDCPAPTKRSHASRCLVVRTRPLDPGPRLRPLRPMAKLANPIDPLVAAPPR
jgi:hypothetical protein